MVQEEVALARLQFLQRSQETGFLVLQRLVRSRITDILEIIFLIRIHAVNARQVVLLGKPEGQFVHFFTESGRSHVPRHVAQLRNILQRRLYLRTELLFNLADVPLMFGERLSRIVGIGLNHRIKVTVLIRQAGTMGQRAPFHVLPFAGQRQVQAHIQSRILLQHLHCFREPGSHRHNLHALGDAVAVSSHTGLVHRMESTHIVNAYYQLRGSVLPPCRNRTCHQQASGQKRQIVFHVLLSV